MIEAAEFEKRYGKRLMFAFDDIGIFDPAPF
jgi:hypothetical protein